MLSNSDKFYIETKHKAGESAAVIGKCIGRRVKDIEKFIKTLPAPEPQPSTKSTQQISPQSTPKPGIRIVTQSDSERGDMAKKVSKTRNDAIFVMDPNKPAR
jgi:hypothetical protein